MVAESRRRRSLFKRFHRDKERKRDDQIKETKKKLLDDITFKMSMKLNSSMSSKGSHKKERKREESVGEARGAFALREFRSIE